MKLRIACAFALLFSCAVVLAQEFTPDLPAVPAVEDYETVQTEIAPCGPTQVVEPCGPIQFEQKIVCAPVQVYVEPCAPIQVVEPCGPVGTNQTVVRERVVRERPCLVRTIIADVKAKTVAFVTAKAETRYATRTFERTRVVRTIAGPQTVATPCDPVCADCGQ